MRIGIDGLPLTEILTGVGHYTFELAQHLAVASTEYEVVIVSPRGFLASLDRQQNSLPNLHFVRSRVGPITRRWWSIGLPRYLARNKVDVFHGTNFEIPLRRVCPTVLTIHDLSMMLHPRTHEAKRVRRGQRRLPLMARAATVIVTPTESVRHEVHAQLQIPLDRIFAVPEAARGCFRRLDQAQTIGTRRRLGIQAEFLLFVGTVEPRKNLATLLRAFEKVTRARPKPLQLVIAGRKGWLVNDLFESIRRSPAARNIIWTDYLSDDDLCALYSACAALVYPSIYEGFGLPPLEAMACGVPVIASRIPAIEEVVGQAARFFNPEDADDLTRSILEVLESEQIRNALLAAQRRRAEQFSWLRTAELTSTVYGAAIELFRSTKGKAG